MEYEIEGEMLNPHEEELDGEVLNNEPAIRQRQPSWRNNEMADRQLSEPLPHEQVTEPFMWTNHSAPTETCV